MLAAALAPRVSANPALPPLPSPPRLSCRQPCSRRVLTVAAQPAAGGKGGRRGGAPRPRRERVTFVLPGQVIVASLVNQRTLDRVLDATGAIGFEALDGTLCTLVEKLPEGGRVKVVMPAEPPVAKQGCNLQSLYDNDTRGNGLEMEAFLRSVASADAPGVPLTTLQTAPFIGAAGQDYVQVDAGVVVGDTVYVGEYKRVLYDEHLDDLTAKVNKFRGALQRGRAPDLAAALEGVLKIKLFLGGHAVQPGLPVSELAKQAVRMNIGLVLPSGQALGLASDPPPALWL